MAPIEKGGEVDRPACMPSLLDKQLVFVTGKGGVGKTTISVALAMLAARKGMKTLLCEADGSGDFSSYLGSGPIKYKEREVLERLYAMSMDTEAALREYLHIFMHMPVVGRIGPLASAFDFVASAAPGVKEILITGKLCYEVRERNYDLVIVDSAATGHVISHLAAPQVLNNLVQVGLIRSQTSWMLDILSNHEITGLVVVATPEEMPVSESIELIGKAETETTVGLVATVMNRVFPELFVRSEEDIFNKLCTDQGRERLAQALNGDPDTLLEAARMAVEIRRSSTLHIDRMRHAVGRDVPLLNIPYFFDPGTPDELASKVAGALGDEIGA
ncbi:MAG: AAA family ATPase [Actinobacteria bacterium]|nr:AAA family ATPase [Actinomycetota bacterium]